MRTACFLILVIDLEGLDDQVRGGLPETSLTTYAATWREIAQGFLMISLWGLGEHGKISLTMCVGST